MKACFDTFKDSEHGKKLLGDSEFSKLFTDLEATYDRVKSDILSLSGQKEELFNLARFFSPDGCATILEMNPEMVKAMLGVK